MTLPHKVKRFELKPSRTWSIGMLHVSLVINRKVHVVGISFIYPFGLSSCLQTPIQRNLSVVGQILSQCSWHYVLNSQQILGLNFPSALWWSRYIWFHPHPPFLGPSKSNWLSPDERASGNSVGRTWREDIHTTLFIRTEATALIIVAISTDLHQKYLISICLHQLSNQITCACPSLFGTCKRHLPCSWDPHRGCSQEKLTSLCQSLRLHQARHQEPRRIFLRRFY